MKRGEQGHEAAQCSKKPACLICAAAGRKETSHEACNDRFRSARKASKKAIRDSRR